MRIALVGCSQMKLDRPAPAFELYSSPLFQLEARWAQLRYDRWFIVSAQHGLVEPDAYLSPYDFELSSLSKDQQAWWGVLVVDRLAQLVGAGTEKDRHRAVDLYMGAAYAEAIRPQLEAQTDLVTRWSADEPLRGLGIGSRKSKLAHWIRSWGVDALPSVIVENVIERKRGGA